MSDANAHSKPDHSKSDHSKSDDSQSDTDTPRLASRGKPDVSEASQTPPPSPSTSSSNPGSENEALDAVTIAAFDVDARIFRTLWHSLVMPLDVAHDCLRGDFTRYISPVRVFLALFGLQFTVAAMFGTPLTPTVDTLTLNLSPDAFETWLAGVPRSEINLALDRWFGALMMPIMILASLPYLVLLKLFRISISWWGHVTLYLIPTNASQIIMVAFLPLGMFDVMFFLLATVIGMVAFFMVQGRMIARYYARTAWGASWRITLLVLLLPVSMFLTLLFQQIAIALILDRNFDLSLLELYLLELDHGDPQ